MPTTRTRSERRAFLGTLATTAAVLGSGLAVPSSLEAMPAPDGSDTWLNGLKGTYKQVFDVYKPDEGYGLAYAHTFLATQGPKPDAGAVVVLRHAGFPLALGDAVWKKYGIGKALGVVDPETKAPAVRNPFLKPKPGVLLADDMAIDRLLARGVIFGACNVALNVLSGRFAAGAGVTAAEALKEWTAGIIPGITVIPSGVWGVNRAQVKGCTYCAAG